MLESCIIALKSFNIFIKLKKLIQISYKWAYKSELSRKNFIIIFFQIYAKLLKSPKSYKLSIDRFIKH
jgi:hypothetical protein